MKYSLINSGTLRTIMTTYMLELQTVATKFHIIALKAVSTNSSSTNSTGLEMPGRGLRSMQYRLHIQASANRHSLFFDPFACSVYTLQYGNDRDTAPGTCFGSEKCPELL